MSPPLGDLETERFLEEYWQRRPCLIRQAFPDFTAELDADDIAGLACEELAESRLIIGSYPEHDWALRYGPFFEKDFSLLPGKNWTLLVQDVEKHYPPLRTIFDHFSFLPGWRIDDLMVSVAGPGGSVGPHVDQYDVFLLQVQGRRRWQISESFNATLLKDCELNVLECFEPDQDWVLEPGDLLYLPPGVAHHGVALEQGMTWSIGMRAPSTADFMLALGEWLAQNREEGLRYRDGGMSQPLKAGEIDAAAIERFRQLPLASINHEPDFQFFLGSFMSRYRLAHEPAPPPEAVDVEEVTEALHRGQVVRQNPWTRLLWLNTGPDATLFAAGEPYSCRPDLAEMMCRHPVALTRDPDARMAQTELICELINQGHLYMEMPENSIS